MSLPHWAWVEKTGNRVKTHALSGKEKVPEQQSVNKVILTGFFWDMKGCITIDFLEKGEIVNSSS